MPLVSTGVLDMAAIAQEFGISSNSAIGFDTLYGKSGGVPVSGTISFSNFYGKRTVAPTLTTLANDLGGAGMGPWGGTYVDTSARFLWNTATGASSAAPGWVTFQSIYYNNTNNNINGTFSIAIDNYGKGYVNKSLVHSGYGGWAGVSNAPVTLTSGSNLIEITAQNQGGNNNPAMICYFIRDGNNTTLIRSDNATGTPLTNTTKTWCSTTVGTEPVIS